MVYRQSTTTEHCWICEARTETHCRCCSRPACEQHLDKSRWCDSCDEAYYIHRKSGGGKGVLPRYIGVGLALGIGCAISSVMVAPLLLWTVAGFPLVVVGQRVRARQRYLLESRKVAMLPKPDLE
jgi:hypothetical protein